MSKKTSQPQAEATAQVSETPRRSFLYQATTAVVGAIVGLFPVLAGLAVFFDPLGRKAKGGNWVKVALLDAVPSDGRPIRVPVVTARKDAWNLYPPEPIGSVYLRRAEGETPVAFTSVCPHLGCSVDYKPAQNHFLCPCHNSEFTIEGNRTDPAQSPSPRDMDTVEVEIRNGNEVWVDYQNFKGGVADKVVG